jgi:hypothetical protein
MARPLENMKRLGGRVATKREVSWSHFRRDIFLPIASNSFLNQGCVSREDIFLHRETWRKQLETAFANPGLHPGHVEAGEQEIEKPYQ